MAMRREVGLIGLTFVAVGGVLGSGWLFAPLLASQLAGPAAIIAWGIGGVAMMLLALAFAETAAMFPVAGGIARIPQFSHGRMLAMVFGWSAWGGYCTTATVEVEAAMRYASSYLPWLYEADGTGMTFWGLATAAGLLAILTVVNAFGVAWFARLNTTLTWFKLVVPLLFVVVIFSVRFETENFVGEATGGFAPFGAGGIFAAVASGGIAFAFVGFRHVIDMAGEARNPQFTIPMALGGSVVICLIVYGLMQVSFVGAIPTDELAGGWDKLDAKGTLGPLGALATALGVIWLVSLLNGAAVISPMGGALVAVGSNGRLALAMANNGVFPKRVAELNSYGVPVRGLIINYLVAFAVLVTIDFREIVALNGAAIIMSLCAGPIALLALRLQAPDIPRKFRVPAAPAVAAAGFVIATLMVYWSGWTTMWRLMLLVLVGLIFFMTRLAVIGREELDIRGAIWVLPFLIGLGLLSYFSTYAGGTGDIPDPYGSLLTVGFSLVIFYVAIASRLPRDKFDRYIDEEEAVERDEYGEAGLLETTIKP